MTDAERIAHLEKRVEALEAIIATGKEIFDNPEGEAAQRARKLFADLTAPRPPSPQSFRAPDSVEASIGLSADVELKVGMRVRSALGNCDLGRVRKLREIAKPMALVEFDTGATMWAPLDGLLAVPDDPRQAGADQGAEGGQSAEDQ